MPATEGGIAMPAADDAPSTAAGGVIIIPLEKSVVAGSLASGEEGTTNAGTAANATSPTANVTSPAAGGAATSLTANVTMPVANISQPIQPAQHADSTTAGPAGASGTEGMQAGGTRSP